MTTGRINQVTIVRPAGPSGPPKRAWTRTQVTGARHKGRTAQG